MLLPSCKYFVLILINILSQYIIHSVSTHTISVRSYAEGGINTTFGSITNKQRESNNNSTSTISPSGSDEKYVSRVTDIKNHVTSLKNPRLNQSSLHIQTFPTINPNLSSRSRSPSFPSKLGSHQCQTPNGDFGFCIQLQDCKVLKGIRAKDDKFLNASKCRTDSEGAGPTQICCGKHGNYKKLLMRRPIPKSCGCQNSSKKTKIFGGRQAQLGEFPWMARIMHQHNEVLIPGCVGFLIHRKFILTAAHCVKHPQIKYVGNISEIHLGEHNTTSEIDCTRNNRTCADPLQKMKVKEIFAHPLYDFNDAHQAYDIALIYLIGNANFTNYVSPICLLEKSITTSKYWVSGWGKTENRTRGSDVKMKVEVPTYDKNNCSDKYSNLYVTIDESQVCAGGEKNKDSCEGDSGGPLMVLVNNTHWYAAGIVSFGVKCGLEEWPAVYTNIPFYYKWINDEIYKRINRNKLKKLAVQESHMRHT